MKQGHNEKYYGDTPLEITYSLTLVFVKCYLLNSFVAFRVCFHYLEAGGGGGGGGGGYPFEAFVSGTN